MQITRGNILQSRNFNIPFIWNKELQVFTQVRFIKAHRDDCTYDVDKVFLP